MAWKRCSTWLKSGLQGPLLKNVAWCELLFGAKVRNRLSKMKISITTSAILTMRRIRTQEQELQITSSVSTTNLHVYVFFNCVSGSSDFQKDHSEEQCQEEEDVWGIYWNITTAYIIRGLKIRPPAFRNCCIHVPQNHCQPNVLSSTGLRENESSRRTVHQGVQWFTADYCSGDHLFSSSVGHVWISIFLSIYNTSNSWYYRVI